MGKRCAFAWAVVAMVVAEVALAMTPAPAPAPAVDCLSAVLTLADCLSYVQVGGKATKPERTCCSSLKKVVKTELKCLCEGFENSASLGLDLNMTKALALPAACGISTPPISNCNITGLTAATPASSPSQFFINAPVGSATTSTMAPAASPVKGSAPAKLQFPAVIMGLLLSIAAAAAFPCF